MRQLRILPIIIGCFIVLCPPSFAQEEPSQTVKVREGKLDTTSKNLKETYQSMNAALIATMISPEEFPGPFAGPGFYMGMNGPLVSIGWIKRSENNKAEVRAKRYVPIGSILCADRPLSFGKDPDRYVVYFKGPMGETESFFLVDIKEPNEKQSVYERFIERWKIYLLSQELIR